MKTMFMVVLYVCGAAFGTPNFNSLHYPNGSTQIIHQLPKTNVQIHYVPYSKHFPLFNIKYSNFTSNESLDDDLLSEDDNMSMETIEDVSMSGSCCDELDECNIAKNGYKKDADDYIAKIEELTEGVSVLNSTITVLEKEIQHLRERRHKSNRLMRYKLIDCRNSGKNPIK